MSVSVTSPRKPLSEPHLSAFNPDAIPYQREVIDLFDTYDYSQGNLEVLLSGAYGSAKSVLIAHIIVTHCLLTPGACVAIGRRALPDLKRTLWKEILEHIEKDLKEGVHYEINRTSLIITFRNRAQIMAVSWADGRYAKFRSLKLSGLVFEEMTENDEDDKEAFKQLKARLRRIRGISENFFIGATNPDAPTHWVYKYFIEPNEHEQHLNRYVFYSLTEQNPFLDPAYKAQLRRDLSPKEAERYLEGKWIELYTDFIYFEYKSPDQYRRKQKWELRRDLPIGLTFDFNIGHGKPMSACLFQYDPKADTFHFYAESVIEGARTADIIDDLDERGLLSRDHLIEIDGDAAGKNRDTRSSRSDYDIIMKELASRGVRAVLCVGTKNPPIRTRHNQVNRYCKNAQGQVRLYLYEGCTKADEGLRLTKLVKSGQYLEDDSKDYQHITTAIGYAVVSTTARHQRKQQQGTREL